MIIDFDIRMIAEQTDDGEVSMALETRKLIQTDLDTIWTSWKAIDIVERTKKKSLIIPN